MYLVFPTVYDSKPDYFILLFGNIYLNLVELSKTTSRLILATDMDIEHPLSMPLIHCGLQGKLE